MLSLDEVLARDKKLIVIADPINRSKIETQLKAHNLIEDKNFLYYRKWMRNYFNFLFNECDVLMQDYVELYITNKCTLKCKSCCLLVPEVQPKIDMELKMLKQTVDEYFKYVDYVKVFRVMGGETFLYKDLEDLTKFFGDNYMDKVGHLIYVTNGTIIPSTNILKLMSHYGIEIVISNYSTELSQKKRTELLKRLTEENVKYIIKDNGYWIEQFGNPHEVKHTDEKDLHELFKLCFNRCRHLDNHKLYFCSVDCSAKRVGIIEDVEGDYIDLRKEVKREDILTFDAGDVKNGYVSFCRNCYGGPNCNDRRIPFGEQLD